MPLEQLAGLLAVAAIIGIAVYRNRTGTPARAPLPSQPTPPAKIPKRSPPTQPSSSAADQPAVRSSVRSWGYQLQHIDLKRAADSPFDLIVIDPTRDGSDEGTLKPQEIARLKRKPDGSRRLVIAYLSIGEAESYRGYWQASWKKQKPAWLLAENPEWKENYAVCFWDPGWQSIMCGASDARLDRILSAGFDGVYLDKCDVYEDMRSRRMPAAKARPDLEADMVAFVRKISAHAKHANPDFLVIMQNAESLLDDASLRASLDGVAKEELVFGIDQPEKRNKADDIDWSRGQLDKMKQSGKLVLVVEYLNNQGKIDDAVRTIRPWGYTLYISDKNRELDRLNYTTIEA